MKAIIKHGKNILYTKGVSNDWSNINDNIVINFNNKWIYKSYKFNKKRLKIETTEGPIIIDFDTELKDIRFDGHEKDQLYFKLIKL